MGKLGQLGTAVALSAALTVSPANADTPKSPEVKTEIKDVKAKAKQQLEIMVIENEINSIQVQIKELKAKGLRNLSRKEKIKYFELKDKVIALENKKQEKQKEVIAEEDFKLQKAYEEVNAKLGSIKGSLLGK